MPWSLVAAFQQQGSSICNQRMRYALIDRYFIFKVHTYITIDNTGNIGKYTNNKENMVWKFDGPKYINGYSLDGFRLGCLDSDAQEKVSIV